MIILIQQYITKLLEFISNLIEKNKINSNEIDNIIAKKPLQLKNILNLNYKIKLK